jgi:hypothetical protein
MVNAAITAFTETCRQLDVSSTPLAMLVSVPSQTAILLNLDAAVANYELIETYVISTSRFGVGQQKDSRRTPLGLHRVAEKFGDGLPPGAIFKGRIIVGQITKDDSNANIAHRILWLDGLEPGFNHGNEVDSYSRYIYIHGVGDESTLGQPASQGCIHMTADDLLPLYDQLTINSLVWIGQFPLPQAGGMD